MPWPGPLHSCSGAAQPQPGGDRADGAVDRVQTVGQPFRQRRRHCSGRPGQQPGPPAHPAAGTLVQRRPHGVDVGPQVADRCHLRGIAGPFGCRRDPAQRLCRLADQVPLRGEPGGAAPRRVARIPAVAVVEQGVLQVGPGSQRGSRRGVGVAPAPTADQQPGRTGDSEQQQRAESQDERQDGNPDRAGTDATAAARVEAVLVDVLARTVLTATQAGGRVGARRGLRRGSAGGRAAAGGFLGPGRRRRGRPAGGRLEGHPPGALEVQLRPGV